MIDKKTAALFKCKDQRNCWHDPICKPDMDLMSEIECDQETADDMDAIAFMLEAAEKEGLQCEVVYQLIQGKVLNIPIACSIALSEWDI